MSKRQRHREKLERRSRMNPNNIDPKAQAAFEATLEEEHTLVFKKKELLAIFNILTNVQLKYGDFAVVDPIIKKVMPIVTVDSNIPTAPDNSIVGIKKGVS